MTSYQHKYILQIVSSKSEMIIIDLLKLNVIKQTLTSTVYIYPSNRECYEEKREAHDEMA